MRRRWLVAIVDGLPAGQGRERAHDVLDSTHATELALDVEPRDELGWLDETFAESARRDGLRVDRRTVTMRRAGTIESDAGVLARGGSWLGSTPPDVRILWLRDLVAHGAAGLESTAFAAAIDRTAATIERALDSLADDAEAGYVLVTRAPLVAADHRVDVRRTLRPLVAGSARRRGDRVRVDVAAAAATLEFGSFVDAETTWNARASFGPLPGRWERPAPTRLRLIANPGVAFASRHDGPVRARPEARAALRIAAPWLATRSATPNAVREAWRAALSDSRRHEADAAGGAWSELDAMSALWSFPDLETVFAADAWTAIHGVPDLVSGR